MRYAVVVSALFLSLAASAVATAQPEPVIPTLTPDQLARLHEGEILIEMLGEQDRPGGDVLAIVNAPPARVLDVITEPGSTSDKAESEVLRVEGEYTYTAMTVNAPWPMSDREFVIRERHGSRTLDGQAVLWLDFDCVPDSGNIVDTEGYWLLIPLGDDGLQTLVRYVFSVDIGTWVPDVIINWATENALPDVIEAIRIEAMERDALAQAQQ